MKLFKGDLKYLIKTFGFKNGIRIFLICRKIRKDEFVMNEMVFKLSHSAISEGLKGNHKTANSHRIFANFLTKYHKSVYN